MICTNLCAFCAVVVVGVLGDDFGHGLLVGLILAMMNTEPQLSVDKLSGQSIMGGIIPRSKDFFTINHAVR